MLEDFDLKLLVEPLQTWFLENKRVLPWREHPTGYYVWISEIMLQQTRVEAVKPYFDRFIKELPNIEALANCEEDKLLKLWEGLGYYNRVRNLKIAANQILKEYGGIMPSDYEELLKLKGIGSYTAGAISSIAFGKPVPAVDGNVLRVISRVTADDSDIMKQSVRKNMEQHLLKLMTQHNIDEEDAGCYILEEQNEDIDFEHRTNNPPHQMRRALSGGYGCQLEIEKCQVANANSKSSLYHVIPQIFNQALMELGAMVCVPNGTPHCEVCPWKELCEARKQKRISELPVKKKAKERRIEEKTVLIVKDGEQIALHKRPKKGLLAGLYELPNIEGHLTEQEVTDYLRKQGYEPVRIQKVCDAKHIFSHVEWHMKGYVVFLQAQGYDNPPIQDGEVTCVHEQVGNMYGEYLLHHKNPQTICMDENVLEKNNKNTLDKSTRENDWIFVDVEETKEKYAVPSAFVKYAEYLNLVLGKDAIEPN